MSLELALQQATAAFQQNTAAVEKLIAALTTAPAENADAIAAPAAEKKRTKKEAAPAAPAGEPEKEPSAPSPETGASDASETEDAAPAKAPATYDDVKAVITALSAKKGAKASRELLTRFGGTKTFQDVPSDRWSEIIASAQALLAEEEIPF
jgi:phage I-like protein